MRLPFGCCKPTIIYKSMRNAHTQCSMENSTIREIRISVTQEQYDDLRDAKGDRTWKAAIMQEMLE